MSCSEGADSFADCNLVELSECASGTGVYIECSGGFGLLYGATEYEGWLHHAKGMVCSNGFDNIIADLICAGMGWKLISWEEKMSTPTSSGQLEE